MAICWRNTFSVFKFHQRELVTSRNHSQPVGENKFSRKQPGVVSVRWVNYTKWLRSMKRNKKDNWACTKVTSPQSWSWRLLLGPGWLCSNSPSSCLALGTEGCFLLLLHNEKKKGGISRRGEWGIINLKTNNVFIQATGHYLFKNCESIQKWECKV